MKRYYLGKKYPSVYFTPQEAKCMYYFLQHKTNAEIASITELSIRTIIYYCDNMRCKVYAATKWDLIEKIRATDFVMHLDEISSLAQSDLDQKLHGAPA